MSSTPRSFLLSQLQDLNINVGLYRVDGLAITNATPRDTENIKKAICRFFNNRDLKIPWTRPRTTATGSKFLRFYI